MEAMEFQIGERGLARLSNDKWLATSLLQKAIRRGNVGWGLAASNALFEVDQQRLWRRLAIIAVEDVGLGGLELVGEAVAALRARGRGPLAQRRERALALTERLCRSPKCRAIDDLLGVICYGRHLEDERQRFMRPPLDEVVKVAVREENPEVAAIAAVYASGVTSRSGFPTFGARQGLPSTLFDGYLFGGDFLTVVEMARDGFAGTGCELFALLPIVTRLWNVSDFATVTDEFSVSGTYDGVPACAADYFTRAGRAALDRFLNGSTETARWMREMTGPKHRLQSMGYLLFHADGGLLKERLVWSFGLDIRDKAVRFGNPGMPDAQEALNLFRKDFAEFDAMRCGNHV